MSVAVDFSQPLLAIDTGTAFLSLAAQNAAGKRFCTHLEAGSKQAEQILPEIRRLFQAAGIDAADLAAIVYAQGPGAFTGLRIGAGVAQGLAVPFNTPLIGIPSLDAVASLRQGKCILAATDARMGEVFYAWFDTVNHCRLSSYQVGKANEIQQPESIDASIVTGIGNAFALAETPPFSGSPDMPTASDFLNLALSGRYGATSPAETSLLYVRDKVALTAQEQAERKAV